MFGIPGTIGMAADLAVIVFGFGAIIFVHELGHFVAAKWAGIRVLAFAIGFGPAAVSYRRGMGLRRGTSEPEYQRLAYGAALDHDTPAVSPTEYRLNWLPLGGYVKMLGQEDLNPEAVSADADSYQNRPVWKRMVVISAGVVMNLITAGLLFVLVFMVGLRTEPAAVGSALAGSPASNATISDGSVGLRPGDQILRVDDTNVLEFGDLAQAVAMAPGGSPIELAIERDGSPLTATLTPERDEATKLLSIGISPPRSDRLFDIPAEDWDLFRDRLGLEGLPSGSTLRAINGDPVRTGAGELIESAQRSRGQPMTLVFTHPDGANESSYELTPRPELQSSWVRIEGVNTEMPHLLGLTGVMMVDPESDEDPRQDLRRGDVFARIGAVEFPSVAQGIEQIRARRGKPITIDVLRGEGPILGRELVTIDARVGKDGTVGFLPTETDPVSSLTALPQPSLIDPRTQQTFAPAATRLLDAGGSRIVSIGSTPVSSLHDVRDALLEHAGKSGPDYELEVPVTLELPTPDRARVERLWTLTADELASLSELGWRSPIPAGLFEPESFVLKAENPAGAIGMGLHRTKRVMISTYLTFARLFQGTIKVEHLKGPVGITHMGTLIAQRGWVWVVFFLALISVNLAVINFLPLPIVDGGQFLMLCYEWIRGRPPPIPVQNAVTLAGMLLIGSVFLIVTFHDIRAILGL